MYNPKSKPEAKGKSWRREREERNRRLQQQTSGNAEPEKSAKMADEKQFSETSSSKIASSTDNPKEWGKCWNKNSPAKSPEKESVNQTQSSSNDENDETKGTDEQISVDTNLEDGEVKVDAPSEISQEALEEKRLEEKREAELRLFEEYIFDNKERVKSKLDLRHQNQLHSANRPEEAFFTKLDSSLKKNTAFVKRLKNMTEAQKESLIKDFHVLNLTKYVSEAAAAIVEAKLKLSDVSCAVSLCSLLHQRYVEFTPLLLENWQKVLPLKREEKICNPSKVRVDLRFFAELISCGVFTQKEGLPVLGNLLTVLTSNDKEEHKNANIILSFCKHCGEDYAGLIPRNIRILSEVHKIALPTNSLLPAERQKGLRGLLKEYYKSMSRHLVSDHKELQNVRRLNNRILRTKGELNVDRKEKFEAMQEAYQKLLTTTQSFSELFDENMPELPIEKGIDDEDENAIDVLSRFKDSENEGDSSSLWEDDETRSFYESLQNLKAFIPGILFKDSIQSNQPASDCENDTLPELEEDMSKLDLVDDMMTMVDDILDKPEGESVKDDEEGSPQTEKQSSLEADIVNAFIPDLDVEIEEEAEIETNIPTVSTNKIMFDAFLSTLPNCVNRELIDKAAIDFCMKLNTKPNRKKLVRTLFLVHRTRLDLLPFYSRFVATLHPCMPEISVDLSNMLKHDFKYHIRKKDQINIESKVKTVRFIGELVKFRMFSKSDALYCLKILLLDFSHHQIEMACNLLETCGHFLFRSADSHQRTKVYLDQMMRKKSVQSLNSRYITMIENAFYYCNPPELAKSVKKERPPMNQYIRKLLYTDLSKVNTEKVLKQFRKLNWEDEAITTYAIKCFIASWNVRYYNIRCVANLLAGISQYRDALAPRVIDGVLEDIRIGLEINQPKYNQRRVSTMRFLGEMYNYRLVESAVIFNILYTLITFGTLFNRTDSEIDPPESLFRIKLVCVLLETCGQYFYSGSSKRKLDCFVTYFQHYFWYKKSFEFYTEESPFPITIDYLLKDTLTSVRPKLKFHQSYEDAYSAVVTLERELYAKITSQVPSLKLQLKDPEVERMEAISSNGLAPIQEISEEDADDAFMIQEETLSPGESDFESEGHSQDVRYRHTSGTQDTDGLLSISSDNGVEGMLHGGPKHIQCTEDEDFMTAFDKMLAENIQQRNQEIVKVPQVDISVPMHVRSTKKVQIQSTMEPESPLSDGPSLSESPKNTINFVLMTRKGNKPQYKNLEVPLDSELVTNLKDREKAEKAEKERVKRLTLDINERQEEEDYQEMLASLQRPATVFNMNRERGKPKFYQHPKGAPDADAIFGNRKK